MKKVELAQNYSDIEGLATLITKTLNKDNKNLNLSENKVLMAIAKAGGYSSINDLHKDKVGDKLLSIVNNSDIPLEYLFALGTIDDIINRLSQIRKSLKLKKSSEKQAFDMIEMIIFICHQNKEFNDETFFTLDAIKENLKPQNILALTSEDYKKLYKKSDYYEKLNLFYLSLSGKPKLKEFSLNEYYYYTDELNGHAFNKLDRVSDNAIIMLDRIFTKDYDDQNIYELESHLETWFKKVNYAITHSYALTLLAMKYSEVKTPDAENVFVKKLYELIAKTLEIYPSLLNKINSFLPEKIKVSETEFLLSNTTYFSLEILNTSNYIDGKVFGIPVNVEQHNDLLSIRETNFYYSDKERFLAMFYDYAEIDNIENIEDDFINLYNEEYIMAFSSPINIVDANITDLWEVITAKNYKLIK